MATPNTDDVECDGGMVPCGRCGRTGGRGPTIAAALADAQARYRAAIADTLLRMGGLLREVGQ